jgi:hypothetical protein
MELALELVLDLVLEFVLVMVGFGVVLSCRCYP